MLFVKFLSILLGEPDHFDITDCESVLFDQVDDFACIDVAIRFDHCESFAFLGLELGSGEIISVVDNFKLTGVHVENSADEDIFELNGGIFGFFEEHFSGFEIEHFDSFILGVVSEIVGPYERGR